MLESVSRFLVLRWLGYVLESNNVVARFYVCNALANGLDNASTLVPENDGESTLGVLAGECVGICVADTGVVDLNADLMGPRGRTSTSSMERSLPASQATAACSSQYTCPSFLQT